MSRVIHFPAHRDGGVISPLADQVIWNASGDDPFEFSAMQCARFENAVGRQPHIVYHPISGDIVQMIPANRLGRMTPSLRAIQVMVVGKPEKPFTDFECPSLGALLEWLPVVSDWPSGPPSALPVRSRPVHAGHYGGEQIPGSLIGVGPIDIRRLMKEPMPEEVIVPPGERVNQDPLWIPETVEEEETDEGS